MLATNKNIELNITATFKLKSQTDATICFEKDYTFIADLKKNRLYFGVEDVAQYLIDCAMEINHENFLDEAQSVLSNVDGDFTIEFKNIQYETSDKCVVLDKILECVLNEGLANLAV
jgi:hypothetical protein